MTNDQPLLFDYDVFISHAGEDKDGFVRPLAQAFIEQGVRVWYDEWELVVGDRLRRRIDEGLKRSRFGVVVLSEHFFAKNWPLQELDGLAALEADGSNRILPIWLGLDRDGVAEHAPMLADRIAVNANVGIPNAVEQIRRALDRTPVTSPMPPTVRRGNRKALVDARLRSRSLVGDEGERFADNEDSAQLRLHRRIEGDTAQSRVILSLVPIGAAEELDPLPLLRWATSRDWAGSHPLFGDDKRPRGDGVIVRHSNSEGAGLTRYTYIAGDGYVEWGRALGGTWDNRRGQSWRVIRLTPLLWAANDLVEFLVEIKAEFGLRADFELVVSINHARGAVLSHVGAGWADPWNTLDVPPQSLDDVVQFRRALPAAPGELERRAMLHDLDIYLNGIWGAQARAGGVIQARGHDRIGEHAGQLNAQFKARDPWEK